MQILKALLLFGLAWWVSIYFSAPPTTQIVLHTPRKLERVSSPLLVRAYAPTDWLSEGTVSAVLLDAAGNLIAQVDLQELSKTRVRDKILFQGELVFPHPSTRTGQLILERKVQKERGRTQPLELRF